MSKLAFLREGLLVNDRTATLLDLSIDIPAICYRCGSVALRRDDLLRRYGCDYRIERLYNDGHLDVPRGASTILPAGAAVPALRTVEFVGLRLVFDWRYYP